ncbi:MAG: dehydrogenase maturation factor [Candidatus Woesearchaeota archaeon]|nr:dehydrogenase maturation factor [Candidatus Woesearchaeota archaeon]
MTKILANKRIGILGKGGSGKSTITVLFAKALGNYGYNVCVLDADSTNIGVHKALGFKEPPVSLMDYFGGAIFSGGKVSCPVDDPTPLPDATISISTIPKKYYSSDKEGIFLFQLGKIGDKGPGAGCDGPISKITRDLRVEGIGDQAVTLIDVKAGLEDSARGVITSMDWIITVVDPSIVSIQIAENIKNLISRIKAGELPATKHLESPQLIEEANRIYREARIKGSFVLLNKIKDDEIEKYVSKKIKDKGLMLIGTIHEDSSIALSWLEGKPFDGIETNKEAMDAIKRLEKYVEEQEKNH